jgi:hypothetical protein
MGAFVIAVLARVYVESIADSLDLYQQLSGDSPTHRFEYNGMALAKVGSFLLIEGADAATRTHAATLVTVDIQQAAASIVTNSGSILEGPAAGPNGPRMIARHPDGTVFEYIQVSAGATSATA